MKICLITDNTWVKDSLLKFLDFEYNFTHLDNGDDIKLSYDYIFVDMQVSNNGGPSIVREISRDSKFKNSKIIGPLKYDFHLITKKEKKIKHEVLNAKFHEQEAQIIGYAGTPGAVTIATNMAGRGTDIQLGGNLEIRQAKEIKSLPSNDIS